MKFDSFFFKQNTTGENLLSVTKNLFYHLSIKFSEKNLMERLVLHPQYPSLIALEDILYDYNVENISVQLEETDLDEIEQLPAVFHMNDDQDVNGYFVTVHKISDDSVFFLDPATGWQIDDRNDFLNKWSRKVNLSATNIFSKERKFDEKQIEAVEKKTQKASLIVTPIILALCFSSYLIITADKIELSWLFLLTFKLLGTIVCTLLLLKEYGSNNQILDKICRPITDNHSFNCTSILSSERAKLFNWLSLAEVGLFYFLGGLLALLFSAFNHSVATVLFVLGMAGVMALPFTFYSVYYQARKINAWCTLCLLVQLIIWLEFIVLLSFGNWIFEPITLHSIYALVLGFMIPISCWFIIRPFLGYIENNKEFTKRLRIFETDKSVFKTLLDNGRLGSNFTPSYDIAVGDENNSNKFVLTVSPYCNHCGNALEEAFGLFAAQPDKLSLTIRLKADENEPNAVNWAKHILHMSHHLETENFIVFLLKWYKRYDFDAWIKEHPIPDNHQNGIDIDRLIVEQKEWVLNQKVVETPDIIINKKTMPNGFSYEDLQYFVVEE